MEIIFSKHAREVLKIRRIKRKLIEKALLNPHEIKEEGEINIAHYFLNDKMIRVIFRRMDKAYMVITAYITHKRRYGGIK